MKGRTVTPALGDNLHHIGHAFGRVRVTDYSLVDIGIEPGDLCLVDLTTAPVNGALAVCFTAYGALVVRHVHAADGALWLTAAHADLPVEAYAPAAVIVFGTVVRVIPGAAQPTHTTTCCPSAAGQRQRMDGRAEVTHEGPAVVSPYLTVAETAAHFRVSVATIRQRRGLFAELQHVRTASAGARGRVLVLRASVEALDMKLQQPAQPASETLRLVKKRA